MQLWRERTRRAAFACVALAALVGAAGCGAKGGGPAAGESPARTLFRRHCAACHGPDGTGGQVGALSVPSLRDKPAAERTDQQLFDQIYKGSARGMPPFSYTLTDEEIRTLARFVREEIQGRK
jgi:mono/diheme cytochrome c family protein